MYNVTIIHFLFKCSIQSAFLVNYSNSLKPLSCMKRGYITIRLHWFTFAARTGELQPQHSVLVSVFIVM